MTAHVPKLMPGRMRAMASASGADCVFFAPDEPTDAQLYVYFVRWPERTRAGNAVRLQPRSLLPHPGRPVEPLRAGMTDAKLPSLVEVRDNLIPAAARLLPGVAFTPEAKVMLLAIGLQESRFEHRRQIKGPARGFWQFEAGGGTAGVLRHPATSARASQLVSARLERPSTAAVNEALASDDVLACAFARLLLFTDPRPLPALGNPQAAWDYYVRNWRPGKPHRDTWDALYAKALATIRNT